MEDTLSVIRVIPDNWGDARINDMERVLESASKTMAPFFPLKMLPTIEVSRSEGEPITLYELGPLGEVRMKLNIEGKFWARLTFQFGHEICHVLCGLAKYPNPNLWFEETICEAASLFVLGREAETWAINPPYDNWRDYAPKLRNYRDERIGEAQLPDGASLANMFGKHEQSLRSDPGQRDLNLQMATVILPLLEAEPQLWEAFSNLNTVRGDETRSFAQYLRDWSGASPEIHWEFIRQIAILFGVSLDP